MRLFILIPVFLLLSGTCLAQLPDYRKTWLLKTNLTDATYARVITFPTVNLSVEKQISPYLTLAVEAGYQFYSMKNESGTDTVFFNPKGIRASVGIRFYFADCYKHSTLRTPQGFYWEWQLFCRYRQYSSALSYYTSQDTLNSVRDEFGVQKTCIGGNFLGGYQKTFFKRFAVDCYAGFGLMNRDIQNTGLNYNADHGDRYTRSRHSFLNNSSLHENSGFAVNFTLGIRLGFYLSKPKND